MKEKLQKKVCLTIAASDSGAGAGIQADLKTFAAHDLYGLSVLTAVTAQNSLGITNIEIVSDKIFRAQLEAVFEDYEISAIKIGVLTSVSQIKILVLKLKQYIFKREHLNLNEIPVICDPVLKSTSGTFFSTSDILDSFRQDLIPLVTLLTPNFFEALQLLDLHNEKKFPKKNPSLTLRKEVLVLLKRKFPQTSILLTGGIDFDESNLKTLEDIDKEENRNKECVELMLTTKSPKIHTFKHLFIRSANTHGTGCTLSSAITAYRACGKNLRDSVSAAIVYTSSAIEYGFKIGSGKGVLGHFGIYVPNNQIVSVQKVVKNSDFGERDHRYMGRALELAEQAAKKDEVPVGAVIVHHGQIIAEAYNTREQDHDPCAHAEIIAILQAAQKLGQWRLLECTLYVTLEPCFMCAGAIVNARIPRLIYAATDLKGGAVRSLAHVCDDRRLNHQVNVQVGLLAKESSDLLKNFFKAQRHLNSGQTCP